MVKKETATLLANNKFELDKKTIIYLEEFSKEYGNVGQDKPRCL